MVDHATDAYTASGVGRGVVSPAIQCDLTLAAQDARIPIDLVIAFSRSGGVGFGVGRVGRVPVQHPFGDIAGHVVQAQGVGRSGARGHLMINDAGVAVVAVVFDIAVVGGVGHGQAAGAGGVFPLGLGGQVHGQVQQAAQPLAVAAGLVPSHPPSRILGLHIDFVTIIRLERLFAYGLGVEVKLRKGGLVLLDAKAVAGDLMHRMGVTVAREVGDVALGIDKIG